MKKLNKFVAVLVALAMMAALAVTSAFAADPITEKSIYVSKKLAIAQGLASPENFGFTFTKVSEDGDTPTASMPDITIADAALKDLTDTDSDGYILKNTSVTVKASDYTHPGVYVYELTETIPTTETNGMTYDKNTSYTITVSKDKDGNIYVTGQKNDEDGKPTGTKLTFDTDPGKETSPGTDDNASDLIFNNAYTKTNDQTDTDNGEKASFYVKKTVSGKYGDTTKDFHFAITVTYPETNSAPTGVKFYKTNGTTKEEITELSDVTLKHGESLYAQGAPVGTTYKVVEDLTRDGDTAAAKYTASAVVTEAGDQNADKGITQANNTQGADTTIDNVLVKDGGANTVVVNNENTKDDTTDPGTTGILVSNLPYIVLALVAVGGLVAYVVVRRKADEEA